MSKTHRVLSIDAWASQGGWQWNAWDSVGSISEDVLATLDSEEKLLGWMVAEGFLKAGLTIGKEVEIEDDNDYNIVFSDRTVIYSEDCEDDDCEREHNHYARPIFAIEIGESIEGDEDVQE